MYTGKPMYTFLQFTVALLFVLPDIHVQNGANSFNLAIFHGGLINAFYPIFIFIAIVFKYII